MSHKQAESRKERGSSECRTGRGREAWTMQCRARAEDRSSGECRSHVIHTHKIQLQGNFGKNDASRSSDSCHVRFASILRVGLS